MNELETKLARIGVLLDQHHLDGLLLQRVSSFAWASCGALSYINTASTTGEASLLVTRAGARYLITNNIEAPHYEKEEGLKAQGWEFCLAPWHGVNPAFADLTRGLKIGADVAWPGALDLSAAVSRLRSDLLPIEQERIRSVGQRGAEALCAAARAVRPGMTEYEMAGLVELEARKRLIHPVVVLVATDRRIFDFRHPLPTTKKLEKYAMLIICARDKGLVMAATRLVHFGKLPDEIRRKAEATARVDALVMAATHPGLTFDQMFTEIQKAYASVGYDGEWQLHHQGGSIAYEPREFLAVPGLTEVVKPGMAFAWNPSITGTKSEDTILVSDQGFEVITATPDWPVLPITVGAQTIARPAILEVI
jgi:antitoxin VapB